MSLSISRGNTVWFFCPNLLEGFLMQADTRCTGIYMSVHVHVCYFYVHVCVAGGVCIHVCMSVSLSISLPPSLWNRNLLRTVSHAGVLGLLIHNIKNEVDQALRVCCILYMYIYMYNIHMQY